MRHLGIGLVLAVVLTGACTSGSGSPSTAPTPTRHLVGGGTLPATCTPADPAGNQTVTFVANGDAWAVDPAGGTPVCLFAVDHPGPFVWGPRADRILLGGLEVKGVNGGPDLPPSSDDPALVAWGHPTGLSVVFVSADGSALRKIHPDGASSEDVTPLQRSRYLSLTYHPSGRAIAFVVDRDGAQSIWLASNDGAAAHRLVFSGTGTEFGAIAFEPFGSDLLYAVRRPDGQSEIHRISIAGGSSAPLIWQGARDRTVRDLWPSPDGYRVGFTLASSCADSVAMVTAGDESGKLAMPGTTRPTRALGWLGHGRLLVAAGGCGGQAADLFVVRPGVAASPAPLVTGVTAASIRVPARTPPPPLPQNTGTGSGFA